MRRARRIVIPRRRRVFLGCEGASEASYGAFLNRIDESRSKALHIDNVDLGGGDPLSIVQAAVRQIKDRQNKRGAYEVCAVLLDADKLGQAAERDQRARRILADEDIMAIWQSPCHEALLLRHFPGCAALRPPTPADARSQLLAHWPGYVRPMSALRIAERLSYDRVVQAAAVEPDLRVFIERLRL